MDVIYKHYAGRILQSSLRWAFLLSGEKFNPPSQDGFLHVGVSMTIGRPTDYSTDLANEICARIAEGRSVVSICKDSDMPCRATLYEWLDLHEDFADKYARAREDQADTLADEMLDVAREKSPDQVAAADKRLLLDTLKWRASKLKQRVYGDKVVNEHTGADGKPIAHTITVKFDD